MRNHNSAIARRSALFVAALMTATVVGCSASDDAPDTSSGPTEPATEETTTTTVDQSGYSATIRRTSDGVPHIVANDLPGVFFGQGYASAQDHGCSLADQMLKITGTRAAALGPGDNDANINSDFAWLSIGINELARADYANASDLVVNQFEAFAAG